MVFDSNGQSVAAWIGGHALGHRPGPQHAITLQSEIEVMAPGVVLVDVEATLSRASRSVNATVSLGAVPGRRRLVDFVNLRKADPRFAESNDPDRMVPIVDRPEHLLIGVAGDPLRTNAYVFAHNGMLGFPVADRLER